MNLQEIFVKYNILLTENGKVRKLSDVLEDMYLKLSKNDFEAIRSLMIKEEPENNIFEKFRKNFEE
jgi:predicted glutamine amidotransferase